MGNFEGEIPATSTAKFTEGEKGAATSFKSFNLYDTNIFATFFYSDIEKVWLVVVKSGMITVDGAEVKTSTVLCNTCQIGFETAGVRFENMKNDIGLSQLLVERLLASNNGQMSQEKILELAGAYVGSTLVLECLRANRLFCEEGGSWRIDYRNYIDFLEGRADPLRDTVLCELENVPVATSHSKTFNVNTIWSNAYFTGGYMCPDACATIGAVPGRQKGIPNWPHSARAPAAWKSRKVCLSETGAIAHPRPAAETAADAGASKDRSEHTDMNVSSSSSSAESCVGSADAVGGAGRGPASNGGDGGVLGSPIAGQSFAKRAPDSPDENPAANSQGRGSAGAEGVPSSQSEPKVRQLNTLLNQFTIKNKPILRKCYSMADGSSYLEGYRVLSDSSDRLADEERELKERFNEIKNMAAEIRGSDNKFLECRLHSCVSTAFKAPPGAQAASSAAPPSAAPHQAVQDCCAHPIYEMLKMSRENFVENYIVDFTSNESTSIFDLRSSESPVGSSSTAGESHAAEAFAFMYNRKPYVPKKRKSLLFPVKRYKFYFMLNFSPKVHDLPNYSSGVVITSEYHSDGEPLSDEPQAAPRARSHSKGEPRSFTGRDYDYDLVALIGKKQEKKKKCITGNYFKSFAA